MGEQMKKQLRLGTGILLALIIFGACLDTPDSGEPTEQIQIYNIPAKAYRSVGPDNPHLNEGIAPASYKIYVQISRGMSASASNIAEGAALIDGNSSIVVDLYQPNTDADPWVLTDVPWSGKGGYNIGVFISPANAPNYTYLLSKGGQVTLNQKLKSFNWNSGLMEMWTLGIFGINGPENISDFYDGIVAKDGDITH